MATIKSAHLKQSLNQYVAHSTFTWPCTETDLLYLHSVFTTKGTHTLQVADELSGRLLVQNVLESLAWYYQVACITTAQETIPFADNVIARLPKPLDDIALEKFFLEEFYYDFVWIERTQELQHEGWLENFQTKLQDFQIDQIIPVLVLEYK